MDPTAPFRPRALVVVLGDVGRSPRMINHVRALRRRGWRVALAGYGPNPPPPDVAGDDGVRLHLLDAGGAGLGRILGRLARVVRGESWTAILAQNPPGFPAMLVLGLVGSGSARRIIDWHNFGSSILALRPRGSSAAGFYGWCERRAARLADGHWTVSAALAAKLDGSRSAVVVHDRPSRIFCELAANRGENRAAWWRRVLPEVPAPEAPIWVAAPSSWGPDEDTGAMLGAAEAWRKNPPAWGAAPRIALIATGRGPGQAAFAHAAAAVGAGPVELRTAWIPAEEYPAFLAHADAGLCLHRSSSGLDLPMKLADFRGAGRKALVLDYGPVLAEIFRSGADGWTFRDDQGLEAGLRRIGELSRQELEVPAAADDLWEVEWDRQLGAWAAALEKGIGPT